MLQGDGDDVGSVVISRARVSALYERADPDGEVLALAGGPGLRFAHGEAACTFPDYALLR